MYILDFTTRHQYGLSENGIEVQIELGYGGESVRLLAKIDTGAYACIFNRAYAEELGINVETGKLENFKTANGTFVGYGHKLRMDCLGHTGESMVYFAADISFTRNVLGRKGWLDRHKIGIVDYESLLYLGAATDDVQ